MKKRIIASAVRETQRGMIKNHLWLYRKRMGFSQKHMALLLGHKRTLHVSDYERGRRLPSLKTALKLEIILRVPVAFLYRDLYEDLKGEVRNAEETQQFQNL